MDNRKMTTRDMNILDEIMQDPDTTQANLATRLGVAVGTVNWHIKRLVAKGYVKVKRAERKKLRYIITPEGVALRAKLTMAYVEQSMALYRDTREQARKVLSEAREQGNTSIKILGDGDIADICRLTCIEQGFVVVEDGHDDGVLTIKATGRDLVLENTEGEEIIQAIP